MNQRPVEIELLHHHRIFPFLIEIPYAGQEEMTVLLLNILRITLGEDSYRHDDPL
jgi:hypothetical protein